MYKVRLGKVILTLAFFVAVLIISFNVFAVTNNDSVTEWYIKITDDTKDLTYDTQEIKFKVNDNPNVVRGKFAPGCKANSNFELVLVGMEKTVDLSLVADTSRLSNNISLYAKIDGNDYEFGDEIIITPYLIDEENNGIIPVELVLVWEDGIENMESIEDVLSIPISFTVAEHI